MNDQPITNQTTTVFTLHDGRMFVPDAVLMEAPELAKWFATTDSNYWQRDWCLQGYVGPKEAIDGAS